MVIGLPDDFYPIIFWSGLFEALAWLAFVFPFLKHFDKLVKSTGWLFPILSALYFEVAFIVLIGWGFFSTGFNAVYVVAAMVGFTYGVSYLSLSSNKALTQFLAGSLLNRLTVLLYPVLFLFAFLWLFPSIMPSVAFRFMPEEIRQDIIEETLPKFEVGDQFVDLASALPGLFDEQGMVSGNLTFSSGDFQYVLQWHCGYIIRLEYSIDEELDMTIYGGLNNLPCPDKAQPRIKKIITEAFGSPESFDHFDSTYIRNDTTLVLKKEETFNILGEPISIIEYYDNGKPENETRYTYNSSGLLAEIVEIDHYGKGDTTVEQFTYNNRDSLILKEEVYDELTVTYSFERDSQNRRDTIKIFLHQDSLVETIYHDYDSDGNIVLKEHKAVNDSVIKFTSYQYDDAGRVKMTMDFEANPMLQDTLINLYYYDSLGKLTRIKNHYESDSANVDYRYEYHDNGILKRSTSTPIGYKRANIMTHIYDKHGNRIEYTISGDIGKERKYSSSYTYDSYGNWVVKEKWVDGRPVESLKRTIEYY